MPVLSQNQIASQMVAQLRLLKPSISAEVGTPERLIIDTVAGAISEDSIDLIGLQQALNVDTKFGSNLTNFLAIFGFARQEATTATGFAVFSRAAPANVNILIPQGVLVKSHIASQPEGAIPEFVTTAAVTLEAGKTETAPVPIRATNPGVAGNVAANDITVFTATNLGPILGITAVTNPTATVGGANQEDDNSLKVRFKNTVFRNLSGTEDQFLALAISTAFSTKANVIGPVSKYQEYVQVPGISGELTGDDSTTYRFGGPGGESYSGIPWRVMIYGDGKVANNKLTTESTAGILAGEEIRVFEGGDNPKVAYLGTVKSVKGSTEIELTGNLTATVENGLIQIGPESEIPFINKWTTALSDNPFAKHIWPELPVFVSKASSGISKFFFRDGSDFEFNFPPRFQGDTLREFIAGTGEDPRTDIIAQNQPNITFTNVYLGSEPDAVEALAPGGVVLLEYEYTSSSSRNDPSHNVTNAVDVFVDGVNQQPTTTIFASPQSMITQAFVDEPNSMYYLENYRRDGEPTKRPLEGNILIPLFQEPVLSLPSQITIFTNKYYLGTHYWLVHDVSNYAGTIRARDGIEWSNSIPADLGGEEEGKPTFEHEEPEYKGGNFSLLEPHTKIEVENYTFDQNIPDLQAAFEGARQITTDILAHKAKTRYFKLDITVIYASQATPSTVNNEIRTAISRLFANQYFGSVIRLSDLLQQIHNVSGVENVRWSNDIPNTQDLIRVFETDNSGRPLRGLYADRLHWGINGHKPIHAFYVVGNPTQGNVAVKYGTETESGFLSISDFTVGELNTAIEAALSTNTVETIKEDARATVGVLTPIRSFVVTYKTAQTIDLPVAVYDPLHPVSGGEYAYDTDFFLRDDELPALPEFSIEGSEDTVPGLIIRPRAQNTF